MLRSRFAATALCAFSIFGALLAPVVALAQTSGNDGTTMTEHQGSMNGNSGTNMSGEQGSMNGSTGTTMGSQHQAMGSEPGMPASGHPAQATTGNNMQKPGDTMANQNNMQNHQPMNLPMTGSGDEMPWGLALAAAGALLVAGLALRRGHFTARGR